jgi:hypothetical protein
MRLSTALMEKGDPQAAFGPRMGNDLAGYQRRVLERLLRCVRTVVHRVIVVSRRSLGAQRRGNKATDLPSNPARFTWRSTHPSGPLRLAGDTLIDQIWRGNGQLNRFACPWAKSTGERHRRTVRSDRPENLQESRPEIDVYRSCRATSR